MRVRFILKKNHVFLQFVFTILAFSLELQAKNKGLILPRVSTCAKLMGDGVGKPAVPSSPISHAEIQMKLPAAMKLVAEGLEIVAQRKAPGEPSAEVLLILEEAAGDANMIQKIQEQLRHGGPSVGASSAGTFFDSFKIAKALSSLEELVNAYTKLSIDKNVYTQEMMSHLRQAAADRRATEEQKASMEERRKRVVQEQQERLMAIWRGAGELLDVLRNKNAEKYANTRPEELESNYSSYSQDVLMAMMKYSEDKERELIEQIAQIWAPSPSEKEFVDKFRPFQEKWAKEEVHLRIFFEAVGDLQRQNNYLASPYSRVLWWAAKNGHAEVVKIFLPRMTEGQVSAALYDYTVLASVAMNGHAEVVKILLPNMTAEQVGYVNPESRLTAELWARSKGHAAVADLISQRLRDLQNP